LIDVLIKFNTALVQMPAFAGKYGDGSGPKKFRKRREDVVGE
jgi:hypothetical protein